MQSEDGARQFWIAYGTYNGRRAVKPFVRFFLAKWQEYNKNEAWKTYVADSINLLPSMQRIQKRYSEIINGTDDDRDGNEIAVDIITRMNIKPKKEEV